MVKATAVLDKAGRYGAEEMTNFALRKRPYVLEWAHNTKNNIKKEDEAILEDNHGNVTRGRLEPFPDQGSYF